MIGIEQAAHALGLSERQVYRRVSAVRSVLSDHIRKGENNRLLLDGSAVEILRAVEDYRKAGYSVSQSIERIRDSISGNEGENTGKPEESSSPITDSLTRALIAEKDERIRELRERVEFLEARIERLEPLALPRPRRGFLTLFKRRSD